MGRRRSAQLVVEEAVRNLRNGDGGTMDAGGRRDETDRPHPNGHAFTAMPRRIWSIAESRATIRGQMRANRLRFRNRQCWPTFVYRSAESSASCSGVEGSGTVGRRPRPSRKHYLRARGEVGEARRQGPDVGDVGDLG